MDELVGPNLQIKLSIKEGKGFDKVIHPTVIIATINGHSLETNVFETDPNPQYATDLVWEANKNAVRKMRSAQVPLKIECFMLKENGIKERIGYLLLSIRSAQIVARYKDTCIKSTWNNFLGLRNELKTCKPELLLSLVIEDQVKENPETRATSAKGSIVPYLQREERLIQLGPKETCQDIFLLSITAGMAANLDLLAKEQVTSETTFSFWYRILETDVQLRPFRSNDASSWILNEKIVIRIRSSLSAMKNYLHSNPSLIVFLRHNDSTIGQAEVDLRSLVPTENVQEFLKNSVDASTILDLHCTFTKNSEMGCEDHVRKPYVSLQLKLEFVTGKNPAITESQEGFLSYPMANCCTNSSIQKSSEIESHRNPYGDFKRCRSGEPCVFTCPNLQKKLMIDGSIDRRPTVVQPHISDSVIHCHKDCSNGVEAYHCYYLNIQLDGIKLGLSSSTIYHIEFRFHHPKAEVTSTLHPTIPIPSGERVKLQDINCKLQFVSVANEIKKLLLSFPPKISICDVSKDDKPIIAQTILDVRRMFIQNQFECQYEAALVNSEQKMIGILDIKLYLEDYGPYYRTNDRISAENLGPPILDDSLVYKIVEELETWKERQKEMFRSEMKKKEERHLNLLFAEWQIRRENLEAKFSGNVEQCKLLANNLNHATEDLRARKLQSLEKEAKLIKDKEDLQCRYNHMLQELKENYRKMQEELSVKVKYLEDQNRVLELQVEPLKRENKRLQEIANKLAEKLETYEKGSLTQDQTTSLLQELKSVEEKLVNAQKSKSFFKEQWGRAVREIHKLKMGNQQAAELKIRNSREELKNLDIEDILNAEAPVLSTNQLLLDQPQENTTIILPKSTFSDTMTSDQIFAPVSNLALKSSQRTPKSEITARSEEQEEKLRMLIEERDSLLKTGSYMIDDALIMKLNSEIRSLLIFS